MIPSDVDILICHTMPFGHCDGNGSSSVGCELLRVRTDEIRPKIFIGGHVHSGYGINSMKVLILLMLLY
jgi:Icc-related predicted phosphoesterase